MEQKTKDILIGIIAGAIVAGLTSVLISFIGIIVGGAVAGYIIKGNKKESSLAGAAVGFILGIVIAYLMYTFISIGLPQGNLTVGNTTIVINSTVRSSYETLRNNFGYEAAGTVALSVLLGAVGGLLGMFIKGYVKGRQQAQEAAVRAPRKTKGRIKK